MAVSKLSSLTLPTNSAMKSNTPTSPPSSAGFACNPQNWLVMQLVGQDSP
jgi:hypothetical protein